MKQLGWCLALVVAAAAVGCKSNSDGGDGDGDGDGPSEEDTRPVAGTRLELKSFSAGDVTWSHSVYDSELGANCYFSSGEDGGTYCFPMGSPGANGVYVAFADEACTQPVGVSYETDCVGVSEFAMETQAADCGSSYSTVYRVGDEVTLPTTLYQRDYRGTCAAAPLTGLGYELSEVSLDELASATLEIVERTDELGVEMWVSSDGLRLPRSGYNLGGEHSCDHQRIGPLGAEEGVCIGRVAYTEVGGNYGYADETCEVTTAASTQCEEPLHIVSYGEADGCWESELLSVGAEVDAADIYVTDSEGMCVPGQDLYYDRFFEVGPAADLADLPPMTLSHEGDTRLVQMYYESGGTYLYGTGSAWDSDYETTCYPQTVAGTLYCVPDQIFTLVAGHSTFSDDACTSPIVYTQESTCYETVIPQLIGQRAEGGTMCESPGFAALYSVVPWEGDVIYQSFEDGTCLETPLADGAIYFAQGEELDPAEVLVEVTLDE